MYLASVTDSLCGSWYEAHTHMEAIKGVAQQMRHAWKLPEDFHMPVNIFDIGDCDSWRLCVDGVYLTNDGKETGPFGPVLIVHGSVAECADGSIPLVDCRTLETLQD